MKSRPTAGVTTSAAAPASAATTGVPAAEVVTPAVGRLLTPDDRDALAGALEEALELGDVREECRAHAAQWDWSGVGPRYESLLRQAAEEG